MTKRNNSVLSSPNRQSYVAILLILGRTFSVVFRQAMPIFLVLLFRDKPEEDQPPVFMYVGFALVGLVMTWSFLQFLMTRFYVEDNELLVHSGVLRRKKTSIPVDRIQTVHLEQSFIHQIFDVFRVKIETAGSDKSEVSLLAVTAQIAGAVRDLAVRKVESQKEGLEIAVPDTGEAYVEGDLKASKSNWLFHDVFAVIRIGLTQHHLKSGWLILLFMFWIADNLQQAGFRLENYAHLAEEWQPGMWVFVFFIVFFSVVVVVISVVRSLLRYWEFTVDRQEGGWVITGGLFTRVEKTARDEKIQLIRWSDNWLKKIWNQYDIQLFQATGYKQNTQQRLLIPGSTRAIIQGIYSTLFGAEIPKNLVWQSSHSLFFYRFMVIILVVAALIWSVLVYAGYEEATTLMILLTAYFILKRFLSWRRWKYASHGDLLFLRQGIFAENQFVIPIEKCQSVAILQSPFQRVRSLCTLSIHTAAGSFRIPYLSLQEGSRLAGQILHKSSSVIHPGFSGAL